MTIPSRDEACSLLLDLQPSLRLVRHACAVAEIAAFLARQAQARGIAVDRRLVESAALLHDIDKAMPRGDQPHGEAGARWHVEHGRAELSEAVAWHPVSCLGDDDRYAAFAADANLETRIVAYADKRAAQRLEPMSRRFLRWQRRHPELEASLTRANVRGLALEREVCEMAGVAPSAVRRLRWVDRSMARARRRQAGGPPDPRSRRGPLTAGAAQARAAS